MGCVVLCIALERKVRVVHCTESAVLCIAMKGECCVVHCTGEKVQRCTNEMFRGNAALCIALERKSSVF